MRSCPPFHRPPTSNPLPFPPYRYDDLLPPTSRSCLSRYRRHCEGLLAELEVVGPKGLDRDQAVDRQVMMAELQLQLLDLDRCAKLQSEFEI
jgi:hypothetical protein